MISIKNTFPLMTANKELDQYFPAGYILASITTLPSSCSKESSYSECVGISGNSFTHSISRNRFGLNSRSLIIISCLYHKEILQNMVQTFRYLHSRQASDGCHCESHMNHLSSSKIQKTIVFYHTQRIWCVADCRQPQQHYPCTGIPSLC